jgi:hypothetical protein
VKIKEISVFAYATKGEALDIANQAIDDLCVASVFIVTGLASIAKEPVVYMVMPDQDKETKP